MISRLLLVLVLLGTGCQTAAPERAIKVGRVERSWVDPERASWSGEGPRPLRSMIWFPTDSEAEEEPWLIGSRLLPVFRAGQAVPGAELSDRAARYPLVVLSHGTGGAVAQLAWLAETLAAGGYVVAAVNHHGNTAIEEKTPHGFFLWWERARDLERLVDRVLEDEAFGSRIDASRIGAAGFSLGGYSVLEVAGARTSLDQIEAFCVDHEGDPSCTLPPEAPFSREDLERHVESDPRFRASMAEHGLSYRDPRVRAVVAIAPAAGPALTKKSLREVDIPVLIFVGDRDEQAPAESNARPIASTIRGASLVVLPDVGHYTFLAECGIMGRIVLRTLCVDPGDVSRRDTHRQVGETARRFFDEVLTGP